MEFETAIKDFLLHCQFEKNLLPKTLQAYTIDLNQVNRYLNIKSVPEITKQQIRNYLTSICGLKPKSIKRKIATFKALFNYLEFEDKIVINPFRKMKIIIRDPMEVQPVMDIKEVIKTFEKAYFNKERVKDHNSYSYFECIRNIVILELLFTTGARVSEIANLKRSNINLRTGLVIIKGKGNKERVIQLFNKETICILKEYICRLDKYNKTSESFLLNRSQKKISDQSIRNLVRKIALAAGITKHITPHAFRHTFATLLLEKDVDIKYIQSLLGHSSILTTQLYTHVNAKKQRQILITKHPRKDFSMQDN